MWLNFFFIRSTGRGRKRAPKYRYNTPPKGTLREPRIFGRNFSLYKLPWFVRMWLLFINFTAIYHNICYYLFFVILNLRLRGSHIFSDISWTTSPISNFLDILKSWRIDLKAKKKINWIGDPEVQEKRVQKVRKKPVQHPPKGTQRQFKTQEL